MATYAAVIGGHDCQSTSNSTASWQTVPGRCGKSAINEGLGQIAAWTACSLSASNGQSKYKYIYIYSYIVSFLS